MKYYSLSGTDNNSMFYYNNTSILKYCPKCGLIINRKEAFEASIDTFKIKKKNYNLSSCYDGPAIVSDKFIEVYKKHDLNGLSFIPLPLSPGFSVLQCNNVVKYDYSYNPDLYLKDKCEVCNQWYEISKVRAIKATDDDEGQMQENTFYRTDLEYGEKIMRQPLLLATENVPTFFKHENLKDVYFEIAGIDWIPGNPRANAFK